MSNDMKTVLTTLAMVGGMMLLILLFITGSVLLGKWVAGL